jgi:hypothetical protein
MSENSSSRWWEFYAVRYAMGTVLGALVFYFLCSTNSGWSALLFGGGSPPPTAVPEGLHLVPIKLDKTQMTLLVTYGLVYCYIASAPILVFHATRFLLDYSVQRRAWLWWFLRYLLFPVTVAGGVLWRTNLFWTALGFIFTFIMWGQYWLGVSALLKRRQLYVFYEKLAKRRQQARGGILDSYRHLREHGNSFFIVSLEIVLGLVFFGVGRYQIKEKLSDDGTFIMYLVILLLWIVPSVGVWLIATSFEREFSEAALEVIPDDGDSASKPDQ